MLEPNLKIRFSNFRVNLEMSCELGTSKITYFLAISLKWPIFWPVPVLMWNHPIYNLLWGYFPDKEPISFRVANSEEQEQDRTQRLLEYLAIASKQRLFKMSKVILKGRKASWKLLHFLKTCILSTSIFLSDYHQW